MEDLNLEGLSQIQLTQLDPYTGKPESEGYGETQKPAGKGKSKEATICAIMTEHVSETMWDVIERIVKTSELQEGKGVDRTRARAYYNWISKLHEETEGKKGAPGKRLSGRNPNGK
jgi:hypothetical protein